MAQNFIGFDRDQALLLPPDMRDWVQPGHLALFIIDVVSELDLSRFHARFGAGSRGRPAYPPEVMLAVLLYAYAIGVRSSRAIERRCEEDVAFRVLSADLHPDHSTIARFRADHEAALLAVFTEVLELCRRAGLVKVGVIAIDSTKLHANASSLENRSYEQIVKELLTDAAGQDAREDAEHGDARGDELPDDLANPVTRIERLQAAKRALEAEKQAERDAQQAKRDRREQLKKAGKKVSGRVPAPPDDGPPDGKVNVTDPDSRMVRTPRGFIQGYNAHIAIGEGQIVLAHQVTIGTSDGGQLAPMIECTREQLTQIGIAEPGVFLADAGYWASSQIAQLQADGITVLVPPDKNITQPSDVNRGPGSEQMRERLRDEDGARLYKKRIAIEPVFGQTKHNRTINRFHRRRIAAVRSEWSLITATHNLLKLWRAHPTLA